MCNSFFSDLITVYVNVPPHIPTTTQAMEETCGGKFLTLCEDEQNNNNISERVHN